MSLNPSLVRGVLVFMLVAAPTVALAQPEDRARAVAGCYFVHEPLYGPYRMTFCLGRREGYQIRGGGLDCGAGLKWRWTGPEEIRIDLAEARCGGGGAGWSADSLSCRLDRGGIQPRIVDKSRKGATPDGSAMVNRLHCRYMPSEPGRDPVSITARRVGLDKKA